jgi:hypothetical protein
MEKSLPLWALGRATFIGLKNIASKYFVRPQSNSFKFRILIVVLS